MDCTASGGTKGTEKAKTSGFQPEATCDECGATGAWVFGDRALCEGCYEKSSSCCPEFGREEEDSE